MAVDDALLESILRGYQTRDLSYDTYRNYYDGDHKLALASPKFDSTFGSIFRDFAVNICPAIVDTLADRLQFEGFDFDPASEEAEALALSIWQKNRMDQRVGEVHLESLTVGDGFLLVWPDRQGFPMLWPQRAEQMQIRYDHENPTRVLWASKLWQMGDKRWRLTVYLPDGIYKYVTQRAITSGTAPARFASWRAWQEEGEAWPVNNVYGQVPVFHFPNNASVGTLGRSELRPIIPIQDAINKTAMDMLVGQEYFSLPQRWVTGVEPEIGPDGKPVEPFHVTARKLWLSANPETKFGQFPESDIGKLQDNLDGWIVKAAIIGRTPLHYVTPQSAQFPSGEALEKSEAPLIAKAKKRMKVFGNIWEDVIRFSLRVLSVEVGEIAARWEDPTASAEKAVAERFALYSDRGASLEGAARAAGMREDQIKNILLADTTGLEQ